MVKEMNGHPLYIRDGTSDLLNFRQVFGGEYLPVMADGFEPSVILDLGAYVGYSAVYFKTRFPDATMICVEPSPENFDALKKNLAPYKDVILLNAAVWSKNTPLNIYQVFDGYWGTRINEKENGNVKSITINEIVNIYGLGQIDLLKMDIEGSEISVFSENTEWLDLVSCCAVELHERFFNGCKKAFHDLFSDKDFSIQEISEITIARRK